MPLVATWVDLELIILSSVSQQTQTNVVRYHLYVEAN